jgi:hypothetical protein
VLGFISIADTLKHFSAAGHAPPFTDIMGVVSSPVIAVQHPYGTRAHRATPIQGVSHFKAYAQVFHDVADSVLSFTV